MKGVSIDIKKSFAKLVPEIEFSCPFSGRPAQPVPQVFIQT
jgi:hypothetical protein